MFDTMVLTKALGAFCGALLIFLLGKWLADELYVPRNVSAPQAYAIDTGADDADAEPEEELDFAQAFTQADAGAGARLWSQCRACHAIEDGRNGVGPHLYAVVGREIGVVDGFNYSGALDQAGDDWAPEVLQAFLENPRGVTPGTSMSYAGMGNVQDRANLIAYMINESGQSLDDFVTPAAITEDEDTSEEAPEEEAAEEEQATEEEAAEEEAAAEPEATEEEAAAEPEATEDEAAAEQDEVGTESQFAQLVASVDPDEGARLWNQCRACHALEEGVNRVGPTLHGIVDREVDSVDGFNYSGALSEAASVWTYDNLSAFLADPRGFAPGNSMAFRGIGNEEDRAKVIAYIEAQAQ